MKPKIYMNQLTPIESGAMTTGIILTIYAAEKIIQELKLRKDFEPKKLKKVLPYPKIKIEYPKLDVESIEKSEYRTFIFKFINKIESEFPKSYLKNFYHNIDELEIIRRILIFPFDSSAIYTADKNLIILQTNLLQKYTQETLFHELFHMASTIYLNGKVYSGFSQIIDSFTKIGEGLNEGYTQLLTERYCDCADMKTYKEEVKLAASLEKAIGKEKMQSLYFNANLPGLIKEIGKYSSEEEAIRFIMNVEFIHKYKHKYTTARSHYIMTQKKYKDIYGLLFKIYTRKKNQEFEEKRITEEEYINEIIDYIKYLKLDSGLLSDVENNDRLEILNTSLENIKIKEKILKTI